MASGHCPLPVIFLLIVASMFGIVSWYLVNKVGGNSLKCAFIVQSQCWPNVNECPSEHWHLKEQRQQIKKIKNYFLFNSLLLKQSASQLSAQTGMFSEIPGNSVKSLDWKVPCAALQSSLVAMSHILSDETHFNFSTFQQRLFSRSSTWTKWWTY